MIPSASSSDRTPRPDFALDSSARAAGRTFGRDRFSAERSAMLETALSQQPEIRPEMIARGQRLLADPGYPSLPVLQKVATLLVKSEDLSDDVS